MHMDLQHGILRISLGCVHQFFFNYCLSSTLCIFVVFTPKCQIISRVVDVSESCWCCGGAKRMSQIRRLRNLRGGLIGFSSPSHCSTHNGQSLFQSNNLCLKYNRSSVLKYQMHLITHTPSCVCRTTWNVCINQASLSKMWLAGKISCTACTSQSNTMLL